MVTVLSFVMASIQTQRREAEKQLVLAKKNLTDARTAHMKLYRISGNAVLYEVHCISEVGVMHRSEYVWRARSLVSIPEALRRARKAHYKKFGEGAERYEVTARVGEVRVELPTFLVEQACE